MRDHSSLLSLHSLILAQIPQGNTILNRNSGKLWKLLTNTNQESFFLFKVLTFEKEGQLKIRKCKLYQEAIPRNLGKDLISHALLY